MPDPACDRRHARAWRRLARGAGAMLPGVLVICAALPARADDLAEIQAIREEMRRLEAKVERLEAHHAHAPGNGMHASISHGVRQNQLSGGGATGVSSHPIDPHAVPDLRHLSIGGAAVSPDAQTAAEEANESVQDNDNQQQPQLNMDSSSPLSITQTGVDSLPPVFRIGGVSVRLGGFIDFSNIYRSKNLTSGPATSWGSFPYANSPNAHTGEYRPSAQLTRLSVLLQGTPTDHQVLSAYIETDFGGAAGTANSYQTNSYTPRIRQAYMTFSDTKWGFHVLAGQAWSLTTGYTQGLLSRHEQLPPVVDNNQIPGIVFTRVPQIRFIKDFGRKWWVGLSFEAPQVAFAESDGMLNDGTLEPGVGMRGGTDILYNNSGSGMLNPNAKYSMDVAPDIVLKGALDTRLAHYEVYGLARWFKSLAKTYGSNSIRERVSFAGGVGGDITVHAIPKFLQVTGNVLAGKGIGRYGPSMISDATFKPDGTPAPIPELIGSLGLIGHPTNNVLLYLYGGIETAGRRTYRGLDGMQYGYGVSDLDLESCNIEEITSSTCNAQTRTIADMTVGGWWHVLQGRYGAVMTGVQYTYVHKIAFSGNNGAGRSVDPTTGGNTIYVTFRYLPFQ
ncbi:hypothetical protein CFR71_09815 [Novacetimonas pomaceti]|uniref:Uncharacterized protein n=1 Tax=Novacetimonas pomaceti TaxID=2021998 RepID=A0A318QDN3_9PROT|nr:hypothetical protein CFR71_09815 [Novacetimonas pomaceti]